MYTYIYISHRTDISTGNDFQEETHPREREREREQRRDIDKSNWLVATSGAARVSSYGHQRPYTTCPIANPFNSFLRSISLIRIKLHGTAHKFGAKARALKGASPLPISVKCPVCSMTEATVYPEPVKFGLLYRPSTIIRREMAVLGRREIFFDAWFARGADGIWKYCIFYGICQFWIFEFSPFSLDPIEQGRRKYRIFVISFIEL